MRQKRHVEREENRAKLSGGPRHFICQTTYAATVNGRKTILLSLRSLLGHRIVSLLVKLGLSTVR